jgi:2-dehydro-3-deoxyphosphogluconate aldolase / (4S)-4-hydroxy-2-oxoglutarate aldolase
MVDRSEAAARLCATGVVAVVRAQSSGQLLDVSEALLMGGVDCIEITMTTPNALDVIQACRQHLGDRALVGVGSVLSGKVACEAIDAGAEFVVSPVFKQEILDAAHEAGLPCIPGAMTPTEVLQATDAGADVVKVFPGGQFGPKYIRDLLAPMPHLRLTPTGGVNLETAANWIAAGAVTLGVGSALVTKSALANGDMAEIQRLAGEYVRIVAEARAARETS